MSLLLTLLLLICFSGGLWLMMRLVHAVARITVIANVRKLNHLSLLSPYQKKYLLRDNIAFLLFDLSGLILFITPLFILQNILDISNILILPFLLLVIMIANFMMQRALSLFDKTPPSRIEIITLPALIFGWSAYSFWFALILPYKPDTPPAIFLQTHFYQTISWGTSNPSITIFIMAVCCLFSGWLLLAALIMQRKKRLFFPVEKPLFCLLLLMIQVGISFQGESVFEKAIMLVPPILIITTTLYESYNAHSYQRWHSAFKTSYWKMIWQETPFWLWVFFSYLLLLLIFLYRGDITLEKAAILPNLLLRDIIIIHIIRFLNVRFSVLSSLAIIIILYGAMILFSLDQSIITLSITLMIPIFLSPLLYYVWKKNLKKAERYTPLSDKITLASKQTSSSYH